MQRLERHGSNCEIKGMEYTRLRLLLRTNKNHSPLFGYYWLSLQYLCRIFKLSSNSFRFLVKSSDFLHNSVELKLLHLGSPEALDVISNSQGHTQ